MVTGTKSYDVALSFAGEDRAYAKALADVLRLRGVNVFYDEYEQDQLWGEDLYVYLSDLYQNRARYVVMFVSRHYAAKLWTNHERKAAQARAFRESRAFILPVRLDETEIEGLLPTVAYARWTEEGSEGIANLILKKLGILINSADEGELCLVPSGEFIMGNDDGADNEKPKRLVFLDTYHIYKVPVTIKQYRAFCDATGYPRWFSEQEQEDDYPVTGVSWNDAQAYCRWAGVDLPTEAQWEKAARGTDGRIYPWGNVWRDDNCQWNRPEWSYLGYASRVGSFPHGASPYGVLDMAGNIWEWCNDWYDPEYYRGGPRENPQGPPSGSKRVTRGCGWSDDMLTFPLNFSCSWRDQQVPSFTYRVHGFRCVANATSPLKQATRAEFAHWFEEQRGDPRRLNRS